ncbi:hypothetical protein [Bradyrhizobium jicamae]|uniref:hypothetical protein n=1 Tax=Bradyrhizobium jicamae TaxID=280332 RepID=UPI001BA974C7|nr:hypothetical protein [Bradyrhizobium jicamae]MBR0937487.1 hypothetical protein [Bradyrhizobium jicamae]
MRKRLADDGDKKAQSHRGEREISRNPSRRESRDVSGYTCGPTSGAFYCTGPMGAIGTRLSLRPLLERSVKRDARLGQIMSRECERMSSLLFDKWIMRPPRPAKGPPSLQRGFGAAPAFANAFVAACRAEALANERPDT